MARTKVKLTINRGKIEEFKKKAKLFMGRSLENQVLKSIERGVSPVKGHGRFKRYSDSYKNQIKGTTSQVFSNKELKSFRASDEAISQNKKRKSLNKEVSLGNRFGKRVSPVNLKLEGGLIKSFFKKITKLGVTIGFDNKLADIHNRQGAGKSKVVRRMLPTNAGEKFNKSITTTLVNGLKALARRTFR